MQSNEQVRPFAEHADRALTHPSTFTAPPVRLQRKKNVPPRVGKVVGELGFRYRPSAQADLEAHAHMIRLLAEDLADVPVSLLETAARRWAARSPYMPKACELRALVEEIAAASIPGTDAALADLQAHCDRLNANGGGMYWYVTGTAPHRRVESTRRTM